MKVYRPNHVGISVRKIEVSLAFYEALGFREVSRTNFAPGAMVVHLQLDEFVLELFAYDKNRDVAPMEFGFANDLDVIGMKHFSLATDDIAGALEDLRARGLADETVEIGGIPGVNAKWVFIKDPDGSWVEIIQEERFSIYSKPWQKTA